MGKLQKILMPLFLIVISFGLAGCGGGQDAFTNADGNNDGGGGNGGGGGDGTGLAVSVSLVDAGTGAPITGVSATNPGVLRATVTYDGAALSGEVVTFTVTLGNLNPASGTALTDSNGLASLGLEEGGVDGAGTATASVTYLGETVESSVSYQVVTGGGSVTPTVLRMGSGTPVATNFQEGLIEVGLSTLSAGGTTSATVLIVDENDNLYTVPVDVSFTSGCVGTGLATMDATVTTVNGSASSTYLAQGCVGPDTITASANIGGTTYSASGSVTVQAGAVGSVEYVSATPDNITLQGTGGAGRSETSVVVFRVVDVQGNPVQGQDVTFSLNSTVGGMSLDPASATSDNDGLVQTTVQAGTVATVVRVTASVAAGTNTYESQSDQLVVTTGIPDQDSLDLSAVILNPEGWDYSGTTVEITARMADRFNNPVPDGTAITFTTEGGVIDGSCTTVNGACTVTWTSQAPRPCGQTLGDSQVTLDTTAGPNTCTVVSGGSTNPSEPQVGVAPLGQPYGGRATILATAVGEESFTDINGNGVFDEGDLFNDLPEAWRDENEDGIRDSNEPFLDFKSNGSYDVADGKFNGVLCDRPTSNDCGENQTLNVRRSLVLVMSGSSAYMQMVPSTITFPNGGAGSGILYFSDLHNQPMPAGTTVDISVSSGFKLLSGSSYTMPSTSSNQAWSLGVDVEGPADGTATNGLLTVETTTPNGLVTIQTFGLVESASPPPPSADLAITLADDVDPVAQGSNVTYTLTVTNASGPDTAENVEASFSVDNAFLPVSVASSVGTCSGTTTITCGLGNLAVGATETVTIVLRADDTTALTNNLLVSQTASVSSTTSDDTTSNNSVGEFTTITP